MMTHPFQTCHTKMVGRPKAHWTLMNLKRVWDELGISARYTGPGGPEFDHKKYEHLPLIFEAAQLMSSK